VFVPLACAESRLIINLLEPQASDALVSWGLINAIFEDKEYFESYVMEPLAQRMMAMDAELARAFKGKVDRDSVFAGNPRARLRFFYERSPYYDQEKNLYPVFRVVQPLDEAVLGDQ
ncbi:peptidase M14, partial [candidate division KSB1 bacterium]|nr:peptidase M14 [candidate division KSB1 bacterium]